MTTAQRFQSKLALVTGGASGIGRAVCLALAQEGAAVVVADRDQAAGEQVAGQITAAGGEAICVPVDVTRDEQVAELVQIACARGRGLSLVCHAAGIESVGTVTSLSTDDWRRTLDVILTGTYLVAKHVMPALVAAEKGALVNIASLYGVVATRNMVAYCAAKGGVVMLSKAMALDYAAQGVRINAVCPGPVRTPMLSRIIAEFRKEGAGVAESPIQGIPLAKTATPQDIAAAVLYLLSDDAGHITGTTLMVDGGVTAG